MAKFNIRAREFFTHKITLCVLALLGAVAPWLYHCCRTGHVFIDLVVFDGCSQMIFWLMVLSAVFSAVVAFVRLKNPVVHSTLLPTTKTFYILSVVSFVFNLIFTAIWVAFIATMGSESISIAKIMLRETVYIALPIILVGFFAIVFPSVTNKSTRIALVSVLSITAILCLINAFYPFSTYEFVSDPMVIDTGKDYSVVFATTDNGTGYVEYTYQGENYLIYDTESGRKINAKIHSVSVPYSHLNGNTYRVGATRVLDELSYGGRTGKELVSQDYHFVRNYDPEQKVLCVSDWHTHNDKALSAISHIDGYDSVILLGDAVPGLMYEEEAVEFIVKFGGNVSKGVMPVFYARGNHETRGAYASSLPSALGLDCFYIDIDVGAYRFIILDSAEDKEDTHPEYGGMTDYAYYREQMVEWLENLSPTPDKTTIILSHDVNVCLETDLAIRAYEKIKELDGKLIIGGHSHDVEFNVNNGILYYMDGGNTEKTYVASILSLENGKINITAVNMQGETVGNYTIE